MAGGDVQFLVGTLVTEQVAVDDVVLDLPAYKNIECDFELLVLADTIGTDFNKNDRSSDFFQQGIRVTSSALFLEKKIDGTFTEVATLNDNTFGEFYEFGFWAVANSFNSIGFVTNWTTLLQSLDPNLGEGVYRIRCDHTTIDASVVSEYGCERRLCLYVPERAENTVRFTYYLNGLHGNVKKRTVQTNYGTNIISNTFGWFEQIRVHGFFGFETREQEKSNRIFKNKSKQLLTNKQTPKFTCFLDWEYLNMEAHHKLMQMFQSSWCFVTDYNQNSNPDSFIDFPVDPVGSYEPDYFRGNKNSPVTLEFEQKFDTFNWKPC